MRTVGQARDPISLIPRHPPVHRLPSNAMPLGDLDRRKHGQHFRHGPVPLLDHVQLPKHERERHRSSGATVSHIKTEPGTRGARVRAAARAPPTARPVTGWPPLRPPTTPAQERPSSPRSSLEPGAARPPARLDYVFTGCWHAHPKAHCRIHAASIAFDQAAGGTWASDHCGVIADLETGRAAERTCQPRRTAPPARCC
jgi:hypothetical protein